MNDIEALMKYDLILLDLDGTLLDFEQAQKIALEKVLREFKFKFDEMALEVYRAANNRCWEKYEQGLITKAELFINRFTDFFEEMNWDRAAAEAVNIKYTQILPACKRIPPESVALCRELSKLADILITTNGEAKGQMAVIETSGIVPFIKGVVVSESVGRPKPDPRFFDYAFNMLNFSNKGRAIILGDSLSADIKGGADFGIDTCWFNPKDTPLTGDIKPTYIIKELSQMLEICSNI